MKKLIIFLSLCSIGLVSKAQFIDSLQASINRNGSFTFSFTSRNSFITNNVADIFGFAVGVTFDKKIGMGGGINFLNSNVYKPVTENGTIDTAKLSFFFFSYYVQYIMNLTKHWKLYITPINIGIGNSNYQYSDKAGQHTIDLQTVILTEPGVELDYNFNKYFGLYTQVNYRLMILNNPDINQTFNSPTYAYGILIYPLEIYAGLFPRTKLAHLIESN